MAALVFVSRHARATTRIARAVMRAAIVAACAVTCAMTCTVTTAIAQATLPTPAAPTPVAPTPAAPVTAILDAFRTHAIVALDEGTHGNEQSAALRLALLRDPRFPSTVNDIIVEFGSALYQERMDRFVSGGDVSDADLRQAWRNTTQPNAVWDGPVYEEFFRAVRAVNASLPRERQIRVLLGDPPMDWARIRIPEDRAVLRDWMKERDRHAAGVIQREVIAKHRRALIIYSGLHLQRESIGANYERSPLADTVVSETERLSSTRVFAIWTQMASDLKTLEPSVASWPVPSLALLRGTTLGALDFSAFFPVEPQRVVTRDDNPTPVPRDQWRPRRMEDQFDAVLYLGPPSALTKAPLPATLCSEPDYLAMRTERAQLSGPQGAAEVERLVRACAESESHAK